MNYEIVWIDRNIQFVKCRSDFQTFIPGAEIHNMFDSKNRKQAIEALIHFCSELTIPNADVLWMTKVAERLIEIIDVWEITTAEFLDMERMLRGYLIASKVIAITRKILIEAKVY